MNSMIDILLDNPEDGGYDPFELEVTNPLKMYMEQIKMALESDLGSIMGSAVTMSIEQMVFEQNLDAVSIKSKISQILGNFCSLYEDFETSIDVFFSKGELREICLIEIIVNKEYSYKMLIK